MTNDERAAVRALAAKYAECPADLSPREIVAAARREMVAVTQAAVSVGRGAWLLMVAERYARLKARATCNDPS